MDSLLEPEDRLREQYLHAPWGELGRSATLGIVSLFSKFVLNVMNTTQVDDLDSFLTHVIDRETGRGLLTVSNHTSTLDDPMIFSAMLPWSFFLTEHLYQHNRWSLCAREICYRNAFLSQFFHSGKTLPIERGAGPTQPVMKFVAYEVAHGSWVHVFPEGKINYTGTLGPLRWGIGKLFCDAVNISKGEKTPLVVPFYHSGMGRILPKHGRMPRMGHHVDVVVGKPVHLDDLAVQCRALGKEEQQCAWKEITERIREALRELEKRSPLKNVDQVPGKEAADVLRQSEGALPGTSSSSSSSSSSNG